MNRLTATLREQQAETAKLDAAIAANLKTKDSAVKVLGDETLRTQTVLEQAALLSEEWAA